MRSFRGTGRHRWIVNMIVPEELGLQLLWAHIWIQGKSQILNPKPLTLNPKPKAGRCNVIKQHDWDALPTGTTPLIQSSGLRLRNLNPITSTGKPYCLLDNRATYIKFPNSNPVILHQGFQCRKLRVMAQTHI